MYIHRHHHHRALKRHTRNPRHDQYETVLSNSERDLQLLGEIAMSATPNKEQRLLALSLFSMSTVLLFADQNLLSPNLTAIASDFGLDEYERDRKLGGDLSLAFFLVGAPASVIIGSLADHFNRSVLFAITIGIGESACLATYFTTTYTQLYICRALAGCAVGGALPLIFSILGDLFAAQDRHVVSALVSFGTGAGISVGQAIAGYIGPTFGWRAPFVIVAAPALLCALLVFLLVDDPERGAMEQVTEDHHEIPLQQEHSMLPQHQHTARNDIIIDPPRQQQIMELPEMTRQSTSNGEIQLQVETTTTTTSNDHDNETKNSNCFSLSSTTNNNLKKLSNKRRPSSTSLIRKDQSTYLTDVELTDEIADMVVADHSSHLQTLLSLSLAFWRTAQQLFSSPTVVLAMFQGAPGCIPWGILNVFLNDYLSEDCGYSVQTATTILLCFSIGNVGGLFIGGAGGRYLHRIDTRYPSILAGSTAILGCFPFWALLNFVHAQTTPFPLVVGIAMLAGLSAGPTGPIIKATMTNVTLPKTRGQAFSLFALFDDFGKALGPYNVSLLIAQFHSRKLAFNLGVFGWVSCGIMNLVIFWTVQKDEAKLQRNMRRHKIDNGNINDNNNNNMYLHTHKEEESELPL